MVLLKSKIPDISSLATKTALTTVENKIPEIIALKLQKLKINSIIIIMINILQLQSLSKLTADVFNARIVQADLQTKTVFDAKLWSLIRKVTQNKAKHLLVENELRKVKTFDSS